MPTSGERPTETGEPAAVVRGFLDLLERGNAREAVALVADDVEWRNSSLPTLRGPRVASALIAMERRGVQFSVDLHHVAVDGEAVLTDRTDHLRFRGWEASFWVCGTFVVREGRVVLWDDHYAIGNVLAGALRGLWGLVRRSASRDD